MAFVDANGAKFYYEIHGDGPPLMLVGGYTCDYQFWSPVLEQLAQRFTVLVYDNRGVGRTTDDGCALSAELMADDAIALAAAVKFVKPHVAGLSMGGTIAQYMATRHADKISHLALLCTSAKWRRAMLQGFRSQLVMRENGFDFDTIFDATIGWSHGENFLSDPSRVAAFKQEILDMPYPQTVEGQRRQFTVLESFDGRDNLSKINAKTLVMNGKQDIIALSFEAEFIANAIPNATRIEVDSAHAILVEQTEQVVTHLCDFFK